MTAYLHAYQMIPLARMADLFHAIAVHRLSEGTLLRFISNMAGKVEAYEDTIREHLLTSPSLHADETGIRVKGAERWVHVASTKKWTLLTADVSRGSDGMAKGGVLPSYTDIVCHDFYGAYTKKDTFLFALA